MPLSSRQTSSSRSLISRGCLSQPLSTKRTTHAIRISPTIMKKKQATLNDEQRRQIDYRRATYSWLAPEKDNKSTRSKPQSCCSRVNNNHSQIVGAMISPTNKQAWIIVDTDRRETERPSRKSTPQVSMQQTNLDWQLLATYINCGFAARINVKYERIFTENSISKPFFSCFL